MRLHQGKGWPNIVTQGNADLFAFTDVVDRVATGKSLLCTDRKLLQANKRHPEGRHHRLRSPCCLHHQARQPRRHHLRTPLAAETASVGEMLRADASSFTLSGTETGYAASTPCSCYRTAGLFPFRFVLTPWRVSTGSSDKSSRARN